MWRRIWKILQNFWRTKQGLNPKPSKPAIATVGMHATLAVLAITFLLLVRASHKERAPRWASERTGPRLLPRSSSTHHARSSSVSARPLLQDMSFHLFLARRQDLWLRAQRQDLCLWGTSHVFATYDANLYASEHLGAKICGAETCNLGATSPGADPLGLNMSLSSRWG